MKTNVFQTAIVLMIAVAGMIVQGGAVPFDGAQWVWYAGDIATPGQQPPECTRYFRRTFTVLTAERTKASLAITADNEWNVYFNGRLVGEGDPGASSWYQPRQFDLSSLVVTGRNTIAIEATNILPGPAGLLVRCVLQPVGEPEQVVDTDSQWRARGEPAPSWQSTSFDDSAWSPAKVVGPYGRGPWGSRLRPALATPLADPLLFDGAEWIWFPGDLDEPGESPPACSRFFRAALECPEGVKLRRSEVIVTADNEWSVYLNGRLIDEGERGGGAWHNPHRLDVTHLVRPGSNVLAIQATNILPGAAGLLAKFRIMTADGSTLLLATDHTWVCIDASPKGWQLPDLDPSAWPTAKPVAPYGGGPWRMNLSLPRRVPLADPVELRDAELTAPVLFIRGNVAKPHHFAFTGTGPDGRTRSWQSRAYPENDVPAPAILGRKLCVLPSATPEAIPDVIVDAGSGSLGSPSVSFDGKTVYFAMAPEGEAFYHIYRISSLGSAPRKLTDGPFHDYDPEPLPDGRIAFSSTRLGSREEYHCNLASSIFTMAEDGTSIQPLTYHIASDREPRVSASGALIVVRSDNFMDRAKVETQLHQIRQDGTGGTVLLGNDRGTVGYNPAFATEGPIRPGLLRQNGFGSPAPLADGRVAALSKDGLVIAEADAGQGRPIVTSRQLLDISPLPEGRLLATSLDRRYLGVVDLQTGEFAAFHQASTRDVHSAVFLGPRKRPPVTASVLPTAHDRSPGRTGYLYCQNVFRSQQEARLRGRVRAVRVFEGVPLALRPDHYHYVHVGVEAVELGTVPLAHDGSFHIEVPADRAVALQAVDGEGRAVVNELSWIYVRPGERRSCVGCHSPRGGAPPGTLTASASAERPIPLLGQGAPYRFRGNNPELGGILNLQFDRFREAASIDLYPEPFSTTSADPSAISARRNAVDQALQLLRAGRGAMRVSAAQRLAVLRDKQAVSGLNETLKDADASVRTNAALALAGCGDRGCLSLLRKILTDPSPNAARAAHLALGNLTGDVVPFAAGGEPDGRSGLWEWEVKLMTPRKVWLEERLAELAGEDDSAHLRAVRALGHLGDRDVTRALSEFVRKRLAPETVGSNARTLLAAVRALGMTGDPSAVPFLVEILRGDTRKGSVPLRRRNMHLAAAAAESLGRIGGREAGQALLDAVPSLQEFWEYSRLSGDHPVLVACHSSVLHFRILEALDAMGSTDARVVPAFIRSVPGDLDRGLLVESDSYENLVGWMVARTGLLEEVTETCLGMLGAPGMRIDETLREAIAAYPYPLSHPGKTLEQLYRDHRRGLTCLPYVPEMRAAHVLSIIAAPAPAVEHMVDVYRRYRKQDVTDSSADFPVARTRAWVCFYLARGLGRTGDGAAADELLQALREGPRELDATPPPPPHPMIYSGITPFHRAAAAYAVGRLRPVGAVAALLAVTGDLNNALDVRHSAARGLAFAATRTDVDAIRALAEAYPEVGTRRMLYASLVEAGSRQ